jgi:hypothetical protein
MHFLFPDDHAVLETHIDCFTFMLQSSAVQSDKGIMQYGNSLDSGESNCLITRLLGKSRFFSSLARIFLQPAPVCDHLLVPV